MNLVAKLPTGGQMSIPASISNKTVKPMIIQQMQTGIALEKPAETCGEASLV